MCSLHSHHGRRATVLNRMCIGVGTCHAHRKNTLGVFVKKATFPMQVKACLLRKISSRTMSSASTLAMCSQCNITTKNTANITSTTWTRTVLQYRQQSVWLMLCAIEDWWVLLTEVQTKPNWMRSLWTSSLKASRTCGQPKHLRKDRRLLFTMDLGTLLHSSTTNTKQGRLRLATKCFVDNT